MVNQAKHATTAQQENLDEFINGIRKLIDEKALDNLGRYINQKTWTQ